MLKYFQEGELDPQIVIRKALDGDYDQLCALCAELDANHIAELPDIFRTFPGKARERSFFFPPPNEVQGITYVAARDSILLGFITLATKLSSPIPLLVPRTITVIDSLYVTSTARRQGIAIALMEKAIEWSKSKNSNAIELTVYEFNWSARQFYLDEGFEDLSQKMILRLK